jgi:RNA polymerase sigma-70 factor, ECF subfamily
MPTPRHEPSRGESSREKLVRRMAAGDHEAMAEFYDQTSSLVFGLALRIVGEHAAAEDIAVEVYAQVWKRAAEYDAVRGSALAWVLTVTRSRAVDLCRARRRDQATEPLDAADGVYCGRPGPEDITAAAERHRFVQRALATLDAELRQVVELSYFAGLTHREIAGRLNQPLGTVKTRIRSAMMQLRALLAPLRGAPLAAEDERS